MYNPSDHNGMMEPKANASCKLFKLYQTNRNERRRKFCPTLKKNAWIELDAVQNVKFIIPLWYEWSLKANAS